MSKLLFATNTRLVFDDYILGNGETSTWVHVCKTHGKQLLACDGVELENTKVITDDCVADEFDSNTPTCGVFGCSNASVTYADFTQCTTEEQECETYVYTALANTHGQSNIVRHNDSDKAMEDYASKKDDEAFTYVALGVEWVYGARDLYDNNRKVQVITMITEKIKATIARIVANEIIYCVTSLVEDLLSNDLVVWDDVENIYINHTDKIGELSDLLDDLNDEVDNNQDALKELKTDSNDTKREIDEADNSYTADDMDVLYSTFNNIQNRIVANVLELGHLQEQIQDVSSEISVLTEEQETPQEALEWWIVTDWMYEKLKEMNEIVLACDYFKVWGRGTSGQSIEIDTVIEELATKVGA